MIHIIIKIPMHVYIIHIKQDRVFHYFEQQFTTKKYWNPLHGDYYQTGRTNRQPLRLSKV